MARDVGGLELLPELLHQSLVLPDAVAMLKGFGHLTEGEDVRGIGSEGVPIAFFELLLALCLYQEGAQHHLDLLAAASQLRQLMHAFKRNMCQLYLMLAAYRRAEAIADVVLENEVAVCKEVVWVPDAKALLYQFGLLLLAYLDSQTVHDGFDELVVGHEAEDDHVPCEIFDIHELLVLRPVAEDLLDERVYLLLLLLELLHASRDALREILA